MSDLLAKLEAAYNFHTSGAGFDLSQEDMLCIIEALRYYEDRNAIPPIDDTQPIDAVNLEPSRLEGYKYARNTSLPPIKWRDPDRG